MWPYFWKVWVFNILKHTVNWWTPLHIFSIFQAITHGTTWYDLIRGLATKELIKQGSKPTWGPPGSCRPQVGPMLATWTSLSGKLLTESLVRNYPVCIADAHCILNTAQHTGGCHDVNLVITGTGSICHVTQWRLAQHLFFNGLGHHWSSLLPVRGLAIT